MNERFRYMGKSWPPGSARSGLREKYYPCMTRFITGAVLAVDGGFTGYGRNNMASGTPDPRDLKG